MDQNETLEIQFTFQKSDETRVEGAKKWISLLANLSNEGPYFRDIVSPDTDEELQDIEGKSLFDEDYIDWSVKLSSEAHQEWLDEGGDSSFSEAGFAEYGQSRSVAGRDRRWVSSLAYIWNQQHEPDQFSISIEQPFLDPAPDLPFLQTLLTRVHDWRPVQHMVAGGRSALFSSRAFDDKQTVGWASWWPRPIPPEALRRAHLSAPMLGGTFVASTPEPFDYTQEPQVRAMQDLDVDLNEAGVLRPLTDIPLIP